MHKDSEYYHGKKTKASGKEVSFVSDEEEFSVPYKNEGGVDFVLVTNVTGALIAIYFIIGGFFKYVI